jgi:hypothetical protein
MSAELSIYACRASARKGNHMNSELLYANGAPFHAPGTIIYEEADGSLTLDCPHCGPRRVLRKYEASLQPVARMRP